jgi:hypothetical protein
MRFVICLGALVLSTASAAQSTVTPLRKGSLSKVEIAATIRKHLAPIKACYEEQLSKKPNLRGKVTTKFIIAGTGRVQLAKIDQTTMGYALTEKCIIRIIKTMRFPKPRGGGIVRVVYPFMFQKAGHVKKAKIRQRNEQPPPRLHSQRNIALGVTVAGLGVASTGLLLGDENGQPMFGLVWSGLGIAAIGTASAVWAVMN